MTLQQLHELTGKVLKERPEFSDKEVNVITFCEDEPLVVVSIYKNTIYLKGASIDSEECEEILWQSN